MPKRIPHTDQKIITGEQNSEQYLAMQKKMGQFYLSGFLKLLAKQQKSGRFLEIGPGSGYQTVQAAKTFANTKITALEPSLDMIIMATEYARSENAQDNIQFVQGMVEDKELIKSLGVFDLVYSTFSLDHWQGPSKALQNLYGALKPGGVLLLNDFERHWRNYYLPVKRGIQESIRAPYPPGELSSMMALMNIKNCQLERHFPYLALIIRK